MLSHGHLQGQQEGEEVLITALIIIIISLNNPQAPVPGCFGKRLFAQLVAVPLACPGTYCCHPPVPKRGGPAANWDSPARCKHLLCHQCKPRTSREAGGHSKTPSAPPFSSAK